MANIPENQKLWDSILLQARAKYPSRKGTSGLGYAAARWASNEYKKRGGTYVTSKREIPENMRDRKKEEQDKLEEKKKKAKSTNVKNKYFKR